MSFTIRSRRPLAGFLTLLVAVVLLVSPASAQEPELTLRINDTSAYPGQQNVAISVYLSNPFDSVVGFNFWVQLDRPDIMVFPTIADTVIHATYWDCLEWNGMTCVDSVLVNESAEWDFCHADTLVTMWGCLDTVGTLVSGWDFVIATSLSGMGYDLNVVAFANTFGQPFTNGIPPQEGGLLIKLLADVYLIPDTMVDRTVNILLHPYIGQHFCFSDPYGQCIGLNGTVEVDNGSLTVFSDHLYGDVDCSGQSDISDLVYLIEYMFVGGPVVECIENIDCDDDDMITITDLICLIEWMFYSP